MRSSRILALSLLVGSLAILTAQGDPRERIHTARELAKQGSQAIPKLQPMLSDPDLDVRIEAVKAIVEIGTQASLDPLIQATRDNDPEIQIRATDGLVNFYLPGYVRTGLSASLRRIGAAIKAKFTETNDQVIDPYVQARPEVIEALGKLARGGSSMESRANAARAIGVLRGRAALPDLYEALRSKDDQVLYESLIAIQKIRDPAAAPHFAFLLRDLDNRVQLAAIITTGMLRNRDAVPTLRDLLAHPRNKDVRRAALTAIAMISDPANRPLLARYLNDRDAELRAAAAEGLGRLQNPGDRALIEKAFNGERKMSPRLSMAFALVMLGDASISEFSPLQYLVNTLNSVAWRGVARAFLIELARDEAVRRPLETVAVKGTKDEKIGLAVVLGLSGDKASIPCLETLSHDPDSSVSGAALDSLRTLKARLP
jgi:HEAT repeat protein